MLVNPLLSVLSEETRSSLVVKSYDVPIQRVWIASVVPPISIDSFWSGMMHTVLDQIPNECISRNKLPALTPTMPWDLICLKQLMFSFEESPLVTQAQIYTELPQSIAVIAAWWH